MHHVFVDPFFAALFAWLAFNLVLFRMEKDQSDEKGLDFHVIEYFKRVWDNWLASLFCVPIVLYLGYYQLDIGMIDVTHPKWYYLYYLGAGFLPEFVIVAYKKWKTKNNSNDE